MDTVGFAVIVLAALVAAYLVVPRSSGTWLRALSLVLLADAVYWSWEWGRGGEPGPHGWQPYVNIVTWWCGWALLLALLAAAIAGRGRREVAGRSSGGSERGLRVRAVRTRSSRQRKR